MKLLCPGCEGLAEPRSFRMEGAALVLECGLCGVESRLSPPPLEASWPARAAAVEDAPNVVPFRPLQAPSAAPAPASGEESWLEVPEGRCPKCVAPRRAGALACAQCGLVFDGSTPEQHQPSEWLVASWRELTRSWESPEAHERFVKDALLRQELLAAGRLYRIRLARRPGDAMAAHGRDALVQAASSATQLAQAEPDVSAEAGRVRAVLAIAVGLVLLVLMFVAGRHFLAGML